MVRPIFRPQSGGTGVDACILVLPAIAIFLLLVACTPEASSPAVDPTASVAPATPTTAASTPVITATALTLAGFHVHRCRHCHVPGRHRPSQPFPHCFRNSDYRYGDSPHFRTIPNPDAVRPTAVAEPMGIPVPPRRDLYELARSLRLKSHDAILPLRYEIPTDYEVGHVETFSVLTDVDTVTFGEISATLRNVSDNAYWYVQDGWRFDEGDLEEAVRVFEERILPQLTAYFGPLWPPGTPEGHRITILHARSRGLAGYFSSADEYPTLVHKNSNQQKMVYINPSVLRIGSSDYLSVLAHELQHAINWNVNGGQGSWLNEGLSQVAENLLNWSPPSVGSYIRSLPTSLVNWPISHENSSSYYGGSFLFSQFLVDQYGSSEGLGDLLATGGSGIVAVNSYLNSLGTDDDFESLFGRWAVANYLGQTGDGPYDYKEFWPTAKPTDVLGQVGAYSFSQPQYSAQYLLIDSEAKDLEVEFSGNTHTPLLAVDPSEGGHCWWGNRGDSISATLTREFDLSNVAQATLRFTMWYRIEEDWDYAYVQVSTDGGSTWDILQGGLSSSDNPSGNSYGPGYTGVTDGWVEDSVRPLTLR